MLEPYLEAFRSYYTLGRNLTIDQVDRAESERNAIELSDRTNTGICQTGSGALIIENAEFIKVCLINFERFIDLFGSVTKAGSGKRCDFIAYSHIPDNLKVAFIELSQCFEVSLEVPPPGWKETCGKRVKATNQLSQSIEKLLNVPEIDQHFSSYSTRAGIFAYRLVDDSEELGPVKQMVSSFNQMTSEIPLLATNGALPFDFEFHQIRYPSHYTW